MCGRYLLTPPVEALRQLFMFEQRPNLMPRYDVALTQGVPIVRLTRDAAGRELIMVRWGLVPFWADDLTIGNRLINARCETVHSARAFRETYSRQRCLVPADGSFEWHCDGNVVRSCTIITCPANELVAPLHDRMPVILAPEAHARWLDPKTDTLGGCSSPSTWLEAFPVAPRVNSPQNDDPECIQPAVVQTTLAL